MEISTAETDSPAACASDKTNPSDTNLADTVSLDSEIDSQKPINMKLRTVIRALLQVDQVKKLNEYKSTQFASCLF